MTSAQFYREILLTAMAYLGINDLDKIKRMTLDEYYLRLEAYQLRNLQRQEELATQAWLNQTVQATVGNKNPKPKYTKFTAFFDRQAYERKIRQTFGDDYMIPEKVSKRESAAKAFFERYKEFERLKAAGKIDMTAWRKESY